MLKKLLCVLISALMVVSLLTVGVMAEEVEIDGTTYTVKGTSTTAQGTLSFLSGADFTDTTLYLCVNYTLNDTSKVGWSPAAIAASSGWTGVISISATTSGVFMVSLVDIASAFETAGYSVSDGVVLNFWESSYATFTSAQLLQAGSSATTTSTTRFIYVNEDYHALIINGHFICIPHTVNANGVCTVCKEYIGTDDVEATTVTVDGVDYVEAFSYDINLASNNWASAALGDSTFAAALNTEGAILQITRDTETIVSYVSGEVWDKVAISANSTNVFLATVGTTADDEDGLVAYTSDNGTIISYDGATVYAALEDAGIAGASSYSLLTNSSESYTITSVKVLIPVGSVVTETVEVAEPAEDTNTETEDDELDVDDSDAEEVTETNPTTGVVLALVPMAFAGFAVVASKRR